jgi:hypothetical protein
MPIYLLETGRLTAITDGLTVLPTGQLVAIDWTTFDLQPTD